MGSEEAVEQNGEEWGSIGIDCEANGLLAMGNDPLSGSLPRVGEWCGSWFGTVGADDAGITTACE